MFEYFLLLLYLILRDEQIKNNSSIILNESLLNFELKTIVECNNLPKLKIEYPISFNFCSFLLFK